MNIFLTLDSNYVYPLLALLNSIKINCTKENIDIYIGYSNLTDEDFTKIHSITDSTNIDIHKIFIDNKKFSNFPILKRTSIETYYRLLVGEILPADIDRVLYLDPDIVVNKDISDFYYIDLKDNIIGAAGHLYGFEDFVNRFRLRCKGDRHFNAGVLLIDLKKWRDYVNINDVFDFIKKNSRKLILADQDVVNSIFDCKILSLDERFYNIDEKTIIDYDKKNPITKEWINNNSLIIHFNGKHKPWKDKPYNGMLGDYFEKYKIDN